MSERRCGSAWPRRPWWRAGLPASACAVGVCAALAGCADGRASSDGRYVGPVVLAPTVAGARCDGPATGLLDLQGRSFDFAPDQGVLVIPGRLAADGALHGALLLHAGATGLTDVPAARPASRTARAAAPEQLAFDGRLQGDSVIGRLAEPRCAADVTLRRR